MTDHAVRACPVCGSTDDSRVFAPSTYDPSRLDVHSYASRKRPEHMWHRLVQCGCDVLYATPVPVVELESAYRDAAFDSVEESRWAARTYREGLRDILAAIPRSGAILDVGTGDGAFLGELLEAGFVDVTGVEPSAAPVAAAGSEIRARIVQGFFKEDLFPPGRFDLVTSFQTLEHLEAPRDICVAAFRMLKPGGVFATVCHDYRALATRVLGMRSPIFDIEHLQLFSPASLSQLLMAAGFVDIQVATIVNRYPLRYWLRLLPLTKLTGRFVEQLGIGGMTLPMPAGNILAVARKGTG